MKDLKKMSLGKSLTKGELKHVLGGSMSGPGAGCRCECDGAMWVYYYKECKSTVYDPNCSHGMASCSPVRG